MIREPFYDPTKTYDENYENGPFGIFSNSLGFSGKTDF